MRNKLVVINALPEPIQPSPGFAKKGLADFKLDIMGLCGFGCRYCSSNAGNYLRINRERFADLTEEQLGERIYPADDPALTFVWEDVLENLQRQLDRKPRDWGEGQVLVFSMLTDGFSPMMVKRGFTEAALRMVLDRTRFRIRILTKNAIVGSPKWVRFFAEHRKRVVVGLSIGTLDDEWAQRVEVGTSKPSARLRALRHLQDADIPTYGMLCPMFPDLLRGDGVEELVDRIDPYAVEDVWAEPYNERFNWKAIRDSHPAGSRTHDMFTRIYQDHEWTRWSSYATRLYVRLREKAAKQGWTRKLHYLLYEGHIVEKHARRFAGLRGVRLQSKPDAGGLSTNPFIAAIQQQIRR